MEYIKLTAGDLLRKFRLAWNGLSACKGNFEITKDNEIMKIIK